jgi:hypothetical protein
MTNHIVHISIFGFHNGKGRRSLQNFSRAVSHDENGLGNITPSEMFKADFLVNLEQCHSIAEAQQSVMGVHTQKVDVRLGVDVSNNEVVDWPAGKLSKLPRNNCDELSS